MVEVFKTNVTNVHQSNNIADVIRSRFSDYKVNFDLDDCDKILRIESTRMVSVDPLIGLLNEMGVKAEILSDEVAPLIII